MAVPIQVIRLGVIGAVIGSFIAFKYVASGMVDDKISAAMSKAGIPASAFSYDNSSVDLLGLNVHLEDVKITLPGQEPVKIEEITLNDFDSKHNIPEFLDVDIDGIEAKKSFNSLGFGDIFAGMDDVNMNLALKYEFDADDKVLDIKKISESVDDLGEISFSTELHNVGSLESFAQQMMRNPYSVAIGKSELEYKDDSLVERLIAYNAKHVGVSADKFKAQLLEKLNKKLQKAEKKENADAEQKYLSALIDLIDNPDEFTISIDPQKPVSLQEMKYGSMDKNLKKLNLEID